MSKKFSVTDIVKERKNELDSSPLFRAPPPSAPVQEAVSGTQLPEKGQAHERIQIPSPLRADRKETNEGQSAPRPPTTELPEKPEKYTTHLEPSLVKKLKLHATEHDLKDYQVIKQALLLYFEKIGK